MREGTFNQINKTGKFLNYANQQKVLIIFSFKYRYQSSALASITLGSSLILSIAWRSSDVAGITLRSSLILSIAFQNKA